MNKRHVIGSLVLAAGIVTMPDGPWWQELSALLLIIAGTRMFELGYF